MQRTTLMMVMLMLATSGAQAQSAAPPAPPPRGTGVGIIVGEPTGISLKHWLSPDRALDLAAAWSFSDNEAFQLHTDYLFHYDKLLDQIKVPGSLPVYLGIGGRVKWQDSANDGKGKGSAEEDGDTRVGIRIPLGVTYLFPKAPFDLFAELAPILDVAPESEMDVSVALGARFYFR
jgi:hypothetical protein